tara:strand:- start:161 stop:382 length:222 start_codon:yes stop_codon:yes gene_type:complete
MENQNINDGRATTSLKNGVVKLVNFAIYCDKLIYKSIYNTITIMEQPRVKRFLKRFNEILVELGNGAGYALRN